MTKKYLVEEIDHLANRSPQHNYRAPAMIDGQGWTIRLIHDGLWFVQALMETAPDLAGRTFDLCEGARPVFRITVAENPEVEAEGIRDEQLKAEVLRLARLLQDKPTDRFRVLLCAQKLLHLHDNHSVCTSAVGCEEALLREEASSQRDETLEELLLFLKAIEATSAYPKTCVRWAETVSELLNK
jgi:hypothetical protein